MDGSRHGALAFNDALRRNKSVVCALSASYVSTFAGYPLDSLKSRLQLVKTHMSVPRLAALVFREEGIMGFYRGLWIPLVTISFVRAASFTIYTETKEFCRVHEILNSERALDAALCGGLGGSLSGSLISFGSAPFELVKVRRQLEYSIAASKGLHIVKPPGTAAAVKEIFKTSGIRGLYSGFRLHFARDTLGTGLYFLEYDGARHLLGRRRNGEQGETPPWLPIPSSLVPFVCGSLAGVTSWALIYPLDVVKTKVQQRALAGERYRGPWETLRRLVRGPDATKPKSILEGGARIYRGLGSDWEILTASGSYSMTLSDYLGYCSIACWLGAQFPQIIKNVQLQSAQGLALPFLANWFLGDASNLLGCILTDQLAFQTWLACYFVSVDVVLLSQYLYYERSRPALVFGRTRGGSTSDRHYRTLSAVAANVSGAAAALAAQQHDGMRRSVDRLSASRVSDEVDEAALATMADSIQSEGLPQRKRVSWSTERHAGGRGGSVGRTPTARSAFLPRLAPEDDSVDRGRSLQREAGDTLQVNSEVPTQTQRRGSRTGVRGANLVFLSVFALYGIGTLTTRSTRSTGRVLLARDPHEPIPSEDPFNELVLGRIFAWLCTTLYLTSRLPQIWKNYVRKSVEGLSMALFCFAFLGNFFYVFSILTSERAHEPPPASTEFLRESLPYLLGSGGTLIFDVTIVIDCRNNSGGLHRRRNGRTEQTPSLFLRPPPPAMTSANDRDASPRPSIASDKHPQLPSPVRPTRTASLRLLFSQISPRHRLLLLLPAFAASIVAGAIAPFMTLVIGEAFDAFADFPKTPNPPQSTKNALLHSMAIAAFELIGLAAGSVLLSSLMSSLWIWTGEQNVRAVRRRVYAAVTQKDMVWFDTKMGSEGTVQAADGEHGPLGAGGLMAKFARETDEVREASSLAAGRIIQYLTTCITCLVLGFARSWSLTLVILSAVPVLVVIQTLSQIIAGPLLNVERSTTAVAATHVDRAVSAISTVKAFNAQKYEQSNLGAALDRMTAATRKLNGVWSMTSGLAQFVMMGMFVQGFWFGSKLVRDGKISPGDVMAVFWACLIATTNLQMCIPQFIILAKGKFAMVSLLTLVDNDDDDFGDVPLNSDFKAPPSRSFPKLSSNRNLRKIRPTKCDGEFALHNISFAYPSRPSVPVLDDVTLFLPAHEMTFIVGGSGSGKSTIAHLLLGLYSPQSGQLQLDDQDIKFIDEKWRRHHVAGVEQGCILFDMSVHDNVALGAGQRPVTRDEVRQACVSALMHEFVRDLPDGYDTLLGTNGASLSGGQQQRLAIARAYLRDPTVLILDEATSALDPTSRILVFEAIKRWRKNKTTIVITHDLSQVTSSDFVYVLKQGSVVEQGYRYDLETGDGEFCSMLATQSASGGYLPEKPVGEPAHDVVQRVYTPIPEEPEMMEHSVGPKAGIALASTFGNWMFDVVADLTTTGAPQSPPTAVVREEEPVMAELPPRKRRPSSTYEPPVLPAPVVTSTPRRMSLQFTPTSSTFSFASSAPLIEDDMDTEKQVRDLARRGTRASSRRRRRPTATQVPSRWDEKKRLPMTDIKIALPDDPNPEEPSPAQMSAWQLVRDVYPTVPYKPLVLLGVIFALISGAMTPIFSYLLSRLFYEVAIGAQHTALINEYGAIVLSAAAFDGIFLGLKYFVMETTSVAWIARMRKTCFESVLSQDKKWFDKTENSPVRLVQVLIKDGDDARNLIAVVLGQLAVVTSMLGVGLIWALVLGWQLTFVGFAIAPVFAAAMAVQTGLVSKAEGRNKRAREEVAQGYYNAILNVRGIRAMGFEAVFQKEFEAASDRALTTGVKGAFVEGCTYGLASGLIYLAEALLFYVGAVLIARGTYTYLQMVQVLNLVVFTVTIGSQLMAFTQRITKSIAATRDFNRLAHLSTRTDESAGVMCPPLDGPITFQNVDFSYPERADVPILKSTNLEIGDGECVAIVGASGSGKSTIAALLQRLYEPQGGKIFVGLNELDSMNVAHLRHHVSVVSQNPNLFDATIAENISYGNRDLTFSDVRRAAQAANVHDFIMSLPQGYDTMVGENAALISGGQAQRLSIARALVRPSKILILDECTSALDPANQAIVLETVRRAKVGRTTIMVTHKLPVMQMCDRILVVHEGRIVEHGSYDQLMHRKGVFAQLANGGEWE
uniref:P-loop containing nucleoside triphosphate hydrolase protein n=1 Tax=Mycena chlorophos TaxID=658473 RepID=A0ABQ0LQ91_MYCCL|nr:predicted protein [Mycena chlorophos]